MDASPNVLAKAVREKRVAIDNDLELLRVRLQKFDPGRMGNARWAKTALPIALGMAALQLWRMRQHSVRPREQPPAHDIADRHQAEHHALPAHAAGWGLAGSAATMLARTATRKAMHKQGGTPRLPRAARQNNGFGMMLLLAVATGALLALADVMQEQRKAPAPEMDS